MPFDTGVPPPRSKYHGVTFKLDNLDICIGTRIQKQSTWADANITSWHLFWNCERFCSPEENPQHQKERKRRNLLRRSRRINESLHRTKSLSRKDTLRNDLKQNFDSSFRSRDISLWKYPFFGLIGPKSREPIFFRTWGFR